MIKDKAKNVIRLLKKPLYTGKRLEHHLDVCAVLGVIMAVIGSITTIMNIVQDRGFMTFTTAAIVLSGVVISISTKFFRNLLAAIISAMVVCVFIFTYYAVSGNNEGFAILWTLIVPTAISYLGGAMYGISMSVYYEILFVVLFYTPLREHMTEHYSQIFIERYPVLFLCSALVNSFAMINHHVSTLAQEEYEEKLRDAVSAAVAAEKAKGHFLAQMSHEIRTPINAVLGMNEMILHKSHDKEIIGYSENISSAGRTLLYLINSILDFSKIEDGKMEIIPVEYDTAAFVNNLVNSVSNRAKEKGLEFRVDIDESIPSGLKGDDVRFSQVVMNLLTNAVKYTERGSVTLSVKNTGREGGDVLICVSVKDTGIGIRQEDMKKLFESFERLDEIRNRNIEGTGLGMSIVAGLLGMMGSELKVSSTYGEGSEFSFTIRQEVTNEEPMGDYSERAANSSEHSGDIIGIYAPKASVLVVDDNEMNLKVAKGLLGLSGIVPDLAVSGAEALRAMREKRYDIVFLDHMMPVMDGIETLAKLREEDLIPDNTVVIALTANAIAGAKESYLNAGFTDYLSKPIEIPSLGSKLRRYLPAEIIEERDETSTAHENDDNVSVTVAGEDEFEVLEFAPEDGSQGSESTGEGNEQKLEALAEKGFAVESGLGYCAHDAGFYIEMLGDFAKSAPVKIANIAEMYKAGDVAGYSVLVHALKSTSLTVGATELSRKAKALEAASKNGDAEFVRSKHGELMALYDETVAAINRIL